MAQINGIQLKNVKQFGGMEGNGFNATVYLNDKKIGTVADDGVGAGIEFDVKPEAEKEFKKAIGKADKETFVCKIMDLIVIEKEFKKAAKKYSNAVIVAIYNAGSYLGKYYLVAPGKINEVIAKEKGNECKIFRKIEDFNLVI